MHLRSHTTLLIATLLMTAAGGAMAQQQQLDTLRKKFTQYRTAQEKIFIHTDRSLYVTGETLWFKLYYTDASLHRPLDLSKIAYVEVLDADDKPVIQTKVELTAGGGSGSLFIPATLTTASYTLRAYTAWMKNFSADLYFHSTISVINPFRTPELERSAANRPPDAQFFPEGGNLVSNLKSKVAFRITDTSGKGMMDCEGVILNDQNETVAAFKPLRQGIGHFFLTPATGNNYRAVIKDAAGKTYTYKLPGALPNGYTLEADHETLRIRTNISTAAHVILFIHTRHMIQRAEVVTLRDGQAIVALNRQQLPEGITHVTLFDAALTPVCERLVFKTPEQKLTLSAAADRAEYNTRRQVNLSVSANGTPAASAHLSVAVYKADSIPALQPQDIASYFWLSSDLKGEVEDPGYYITHTDTLALRAADNLMLTHGWRRCTWKDALTTRPLTPFIPEHKGHIIEARVTDQTDAPVPHIQTYLSAPGKIIRLYGSRSNATGTTRYEMGDFYGNHKIVLQTNRTRDSVYTISVVNPFSEAYSTRPLAPLRLSARISQALLEKTVAMQIQDVYADEKNIRILNPVRDSSAFYGKPDETYLLDDYTRFPVMEEVMREYVPGVLVRKRRDGFHYIVLDNVKKSVLKDDPVILLDGVPIFDADEIMAFDPLKIKRLDVLARQYYLGIMVMQGIVSYSTYHGDMAGFPLTPRALVLDYEGPQVNREFYTPLYEDKKARSSRIPDQRTLIYWNPDVTLTNGESRTLSFYTSDLVGNYQVSIQALTDDGKPASTSASFQVRRFDN